MRTREPVPALNLGSSSSTTTPAVAASTGAPPASRTASAASTALRQPSVRSGGLPTPPCAIAAAFHGFAGSAGAPASGGGGPASEEAVPVQAMRVAQRVDQMKQAGRRRTTLCVAQAANEARED